MRHRVSKRHLTRTPAHLKALRRNLAQSLFQHGQVETTLIKAKEVRPFVERLITLARKGTLQSRKRVIALLGDRSMLRAEHEEQYLTMTDAQREKVFRARSGRRHRTSEVPASYNKKKIPFVAESVVHRLMSEIAPNYKDRPGGYTRIVRLSKRRIGDNADLALLQLVDFEQEDQTRPTTGAKARTGLRRLKAQSRIRYAEGKRQRRGSGRSGKRAAENLEKEAPDSTAGAKEAPAEASHSPDDAESTGAAPKHDE